MVMKILSIEEIKHVTNLYNKGLDAHVIGRQIGIKGTALARWLKKRPEIIWRGKRQYFIDENYFKNINANSAYILGFLAADGSINKHGFGIELQNRDEHILHDFAKELKYEGPITYCFKKCKYEIKKYCRLRICNQNIRSDLISFGIVPNKTYNFDFKFDKIIDYLSHFMRGYFDGDGCLCSCLTKEGHWRHIVNIAVEKKFSYNFQRIIETMTKIDFKIKSRKNRKVINFLLLESHEKVKKFLEWIYADANLMLKRKYKKFLDFLEIYSKHNKNSSKKLTLEQLAEIRKMLELNLVQRDIAKKFDVSTSTIASIKSNRNYKLWPTYTT